MTLPWSLSASLFIFLLGAINLVRASRPRDAALGWICLSAGFGHIASSLRFGVLIGNVFDLRVVIFVLITVALCAMSVRTILRS